MNKDYVYKNANREVIKQLNELATAQNLTPSEIARRTSVPQPTVHRILSGQSEDPKITIIRKIAHCLGTTLAEIESGNQIKSTGNLYAKINSVPLLRWKDLSKISEAEIKESIACPAKGFSLSTFATTVKDNTMTAQYGRSYPEGSIIFVDQERAGSVKAGDKVIALIDGEIPTFKQYGEADGERYLQSINLQYPIINKPFEIIGIVIGMWVPEN